MSFRFESGSSVADNVRRIACEQVELARAHLANPPDDDIHQGIHEARKCFKRLRGLLRMARPALGHDRYRQENIRFRDAARSLSTVRDAQALVESFDMLETRYGLRVDFERMRPLHSRLVQRRERVAREQTDLDERVQQVIGTLDDSMNVIETWPLAHAGCNDIARGMRKVYKRARKGWKRARKNQDPKQMHDWRKRAKYLRYHFQLLTGVDTDRAGGWHKGFRELSDLLGDHHDLEVLRKTLDEMDQSGLDPVAECEFRTLLRDTEDALYLETLSCGDALLKHKPGKMRKRVLHNLLDAQKGC
jgi:CHAD domain-containing protein